MNQILDKGTGSSSRYTIDINAPFSSTSTSFMATRKRGTWKNTQPTGSSKDKNTDGDVEDSGASVSMLMVSRYEERVNSLLEENNDLRQSLFSLQSDLLSLLNDYRANATPSTGTVTSTIPTSATDNPHSPPNIKSTSASTSVESAEVTAGQFQLPFSMVRKDVEGSLREQMIALRNGIHELKKLKEGNDTSKQSEKQGNSRETVASLEQKLCMFQLDIFSDDSYKLVSCQKIIEEQDKLLQMSLLSQNAASSVLNMSLSSSRYVSRTNQVIIANLILECGKMNTKISFNQKQNRYLILLVDNIQ